MRMSLRSMVVAVASALALAILPRRAPRRASTSPNSRSARRTSRPAATPTSRRGFKVDKPGQPEVVNNVNINMPEGVFGNPGAIFRCRAAIFVVNECQPGAQAGLITIVANYEGNPNFVLGTTPIYNMQVLGDEAARMAFVVPILNVPVIMPINVRSDSDYGLQISVNAISQTVALWLGLADGLGLPGATKNTTRERFFPG